MANAIPQQCCRRREEAKKLERKFFGKQSKSYSSCSLNIEAEKFPNIENLTKKSGRKTGNEDPIRVKWTDPEFTLPKMAATDAAENTSKIDRHETESVECTDTPGGCFLRNRIKSDNFPCKIIGPSLCHRLFEVDSSVKADNALHLNGGEGEESSALKNWEKWMNIRRRQNLRFGLKLRRDNCELVMNSGDCVREVREQRDWLMYARMPKLDNWRGNPEFWREPLKLPSKGMKSIYEVHRSLCERGIIPQMEFVTVPNAMKREKNVSCKDCTETAHWDKTEYRMQKEREFAERMRIIVPHKPDARELMIRGRKIYKTERERELSVYRELPEIKITTSEYCEETHFGNIRLLIDGVELYRDGSSGEIGDGHTWSLVFEESLTGTLSTKSLVVENAGTVAVTYGWTKHRHRSSLHSCLPTLKMFQSRFFFNKNPGVFLPGQITKLNFHYFSKSAGYYTESWSLKLNPNLDNNSAVIRLSAVTSSDGKSLECLKLEKYLDECVKESIVRGFVQEIFDRSRPELPSDIPYQSLFLEEDLFEYQNTAHHYRFEAVEELKSLFNRIPLQPAQDWDLNLFTLEDLIRENVVGDEQREMMRRLTELSKALLGPGQSTYKFDHKVKMVYNLLCTAIDAMEANARKILEIFIPNYAIYEEVRSEKSYTSSMTFPGEDGIFYLENCIYNVVLRSSAHYKYLMYLLFYNSLGEAAELVAGVVESWKLFQHHGEIPAGDFDYHC